MRRFACVAVTLIALMLIPVSFAQTSSTTSVPNLVRYQGTLPGSRVAANASTAVGVTFAIYNQQEGGAPIWMETQNITPDAQGNYSVLLGSTTATGLPGDLFSAQEQRWLGVQVQGEAEQPRVMLVSVPYAFKAHEADTLGGMPASAFALAQQSGASNEASGSGGASPSGGEQKDPGHPPAGGHGSTGYLAYWQNPVFLGASDIYQSSGGGIGIGTDLPPYILTVFGTTASGQPVVETVNSGGGGYAIEGSAAATTGPGVGIYGVSYGDSGYGVYGNAKSTTGLNAGVYGSSASSGGYGVYGVASAMTGSTTGVYGASASSTGYGVEGIAQAGSGNAVGVFGETESTTGTGVEGVALSATGVTTGVLGSSSSTAGYGVEGSNTATSGPATGVYGETASTTGNGVAGVASATTGGSMGVYGTTASNAGEGVAGVGVAESNEGALVTFRPIGVWGDTGVDSGTAVGVLGTADNGIAFAGYNNAENISTAKFENDEKIDENGNVFATKGGYFDGFCVIDVSGDLGCSGYITELVRLDDGTRKVALYAVESPENWFEDIGSAQLSNGSTVVQLEPTFAQTVNTGMEYHVFLTPNGDCKGLYVANKTADGFEVHELGGGKANIAFDYRIVARRKGYENVRLADKTKQFDRIANEPRPEPGKVSSPRRIPQQLVSAAK